MPEIAAWLADLTSGDSEQAELAASNPPTDQRKSLAALVELLQEENPGQRWWAARALAEFDSQKAGDLLTNSLSDNDASVQHCAALSLRKRPHPGAMQILVSQLGSSDKLLARLSGDALAALGEDAAPTLLDVLLSENEAARVEAAQALATIGDTRSISGLFKLLESDSALLEHWANEGLENMGIGMRFFEPDN